MADVNTRLYQKTRWAIYFSLFVGYSAYYFARKSFTFAIPSLLRELNVEKSQLGVITSGFSAMYGLSKFTSGLLSDSLSPRTMFAAGMLLTGIINILIGFSSKVWVLTILWSANGLVQGCGWPPCAKLLREWFSSYEVGTLWSLLTAGCNIASSVSPVLTAYLTTNHGLSAGFTVPGVATVVISGFVCYLIVDSPSEIGLDEFRQTITKPKTTTAGNKRAQIKALLTSPFLLILCAGYLMTLFVKTGVGEWTQLFLMQSKGKSQYEAGIAISFLEVGGLVGSVFSGYITDKLLYKYGTSTVASPRIPPMIGFAIVQLTCVYLLHTAVTKTTSLWLVSSLIFGTGFSLYGGINTYGVLAMENGPPGLSGTSHAIVALAANVGATLAGFPLTLISTYYGWSGMFTALALASSFCICLLVGARNVNKQMIDPSKVR